MMEKLSIRVKHSNIHNVLKTWLVIQKDNPFYYECDFEIGLKDEIGTERFSFDFCNLAGLKKIAEKQFDLKKIIHFRNLILTGNTIEPKELVNILIEKIERIECYTKDELQKKLSSIMQSEYIAEFDWNDL